MRKTTVFILFFILAIFLFNTKNIFAMSCTQVGDTSFCDDGTYYTHVGNTTFGSDGTEYSKIGNTTSLNRCPYNSSYDIVSKKCICNSGYVVSGRSCVYKNNNYLNTPVYNLPATSIPNNTRNDYQLTCATGYIKLNGECLSYDQACSTEFGQNWKWDGSRNEKGSLNCGCKSGYVPKDGECITQPADQIKTNEVILPEGCLSTSGYSTTSSVFCGGETTKLIPKTKTTTPTIKKVAEVKTTKAQIDESFANYEGLNPISANNTDTSTTEVKPKGFWTKLKGWLGF